MITYYTMAEAQKKTGLTANRIKSILSRENDIANTKIPKCLIDVIVDEQEQFISFRDFAALPRGERYLGTPRDKSKLRDYLEINDFFGIQLIDPEDLLIGSEQEEIYFRRCDMPRLEKKLASYFELYAFSSEERVEKLLAGREKRNAKRYIREYLQDNWVEITPTVTEFVTHALALPDVQILTDADIQQALTKIQTVAARDILIDYLNVMHRKVIKPNYSRMGQRKTESKPIPAYSDETYLAMARILFSVEYIAEHKMIERALENHWYIEMWLYLSLHYCCGWRAADICRGWCYLNLKDKPNNTFEINVDTLYEDILYDRIPDEIYEKVCQYVLRTIKVAGQLPSKTAGHDPSPLAIEIDPVLLTYFGLLILISEAVMLRTGDGYMRVERADYYQKRFNYQQFFGDELAEVLHGQNIQSRRLNKSYLQGVETTARQSGHGSIMASAIASFARSHSNLDTIIHYLQDHKWSAENAEVVLYYVSKMGVFSALHYQTLLTAYPEAMPRLPLKQRSELIGAIPHDPYKTELLLSGLSAAMEIKIAFDNGYTDKAIAMLESMFEVTQGRGQGKDTGIYCILRAGGDVCKHPDYDSCLANACPYLVFTRFGYRALLEVISEYVQAAASGDVKMAVALKSVIMPRFRTIINTLMQDKHIPQKERAAMKIMLEEVLDGGRKYLTSN